MRRIHVVIALSLSASAANASSGESASVVLSGPAAVSAVACPDGYARDAQRAAVVLEHLRHQDAATTITTTTTTIKTTSMCFGATDVSVVSLDGMLLLDAHADDRALASRVAHLAMHLRDPTRFDPARRSGLDRDCTRWVDSALRAEGEAYVVEIDAARSLNVKTPYVFAHDVERSVDMPMNSRAAIVTSFLRAHPEGGQGMEPLARGYDERCRASIPRE